MSIHPTVAELKAEASRIEHETTLECQTQAREAEINFIREQNELEIVKAKELSAIEVSGSLHCMGVLNHTAGPGYIN